MAGRLPTGEPLMLRLDGVGLTYSNGTTAVAGIDLEVDAGRITVLIGGSGCGKSTVLRLIAGLESATTGTVSIGGQIIDGPSKEVGVVFQEPRLMPWLSVADNVAFGLSHLTTDHSDEVTVASLERVGLAGFADALPKELSGGMAQRVALARALVAAPQVLLLDEPFSALDALTRADLQQHLLDLWSADHQTLVVVTHDIDEALFLADTIVVMAGHPGEIVQRVEVTASRPRRLADLELLTIRETVLASLANSKANQPS
ncbi:MAG: ABC transporter ATP-binding protein [Acidimicrobiia bacterium]